MAKRGRPQTWDWNALHQFLWDHADSRGILRMQQQELAEIFNVGNGFISQVMDKFEKEGRVHRLSRGNQGARFEIKDPGFYTEPAN